MRFALVDQDTNYFTKPEQLESVYKKIWDKTRSLNFGSHLRFFISSTFVGDIIVLPIFLLICIYFC